MRQSPCHVIIVIWCVACISPLFSGFFWCSSGFFCVCLVFSGVCLVFSGVRLVFACYSPLFSGVCLVFVLHLSRIGL